jgi:ABC-type Mn2+/Zn2+ transport system permease subunit
MNSQVLVLLGISAGASVGAAAADSYKLTSSPPAPPQAQHFFQELVSDSNGIAIDRSQFVIWTLTLAAVFVYLVWRDLAMPTFDNTVVALMGISSGAYVGLKLPK